MIIRRLLINLYARFHFFIATKQWRIQRWLIKHFSHMMSKLDKEKQLIILDPEFAKSLT